MTCLLTSIKSAHLTASDDGSKMETLTSSGSQTFQRFPDGEGTDAIPRFVSLPGAKEGCFTYWVMQWPLGDCGILQSSLQGSPSLRILKINNWKPLLI